MTALTADRSPSHVYRGDIDDMPHRRPWAGTFKASKTAFMGALCMMVDGVAMPLVSGASWVAATNCTAFGTGNAGLLVTARRKGVKLALLDPAGNSKLLSITITHSTIFTIVSVNLATDNMGAITSTANDVADEIRRNAEADALLRVAQAGTGASAMVAVAATAPIVVEVLGCSTYQIVEDTGSNITLKPSVTFKVNEPGFGMGFLAGTTAPTEGGAAFLIDDQTVSSTQVSELDLQAPCTGVGTQQGGSANYYFVDLTRAK